jgi:hypothetical protein
MIRCAMRALLVEDNESFAGTLARGLQEELIDVDIAKAGEISTGSSMRPNTSASCRRGAMALLASVRRRRRKWVRVRRICSTLHR